MLFRSKLYVFKHDSVLGNCPSHILFEKIQAEQREKNMPPRTFSDYEVKLDEQMPDGVEVLAKL